MTDGAALVQEDADGNPFWTFRVTDALLQANRRIAFPEEVAAYLGCKPGGLTRVAVDHPAGCRKLKVCLEQRDPPHTVVLNIAEPLLGIGTSCGQSVDLVVTGLRRVALRRSRASKHREPAGEPDDRDTSTRDRQSNSPQGPPAPWCSPPTPLLPRWYLLSHGEEMLPQEFTSAYPAAHRIRDLERFWEHHDEPVRADSARSLRYVAQRLLPPKGLRVLPPRLDLDELDRLPLAIRTRNCLRRGATRGSLAKGTVEELMQLPNFGIASLLDLMCVIEAAEAHYGSLDGSPISAATIGKEEDETAAGEGCHSTTITDGAQTSDAVDLIATAAREFRGAATFGDLLRLDLSDLIAAAEGDAEVDDLALEAGTPTVAERAIKLLDACLAQMSETQQLVILKRVVPNVPVTLEVLGRATGLSRERVRQLDKQARAALEEAAGRTLGLLRLIASQRLGAVTTAPGIDDVVGELLPQPDDEARLNSLMVARRMLRSKLDYECREGLCLSRAAADAAKGLNDVARQLVDDEGLLDLDTVRAALAEQWHDSLDDLIRWIGWPRVSGQIALRTTARARTKAALLKIGAPATKAELATESGLTERQVAGALSNIESVARADKLRWGLREWIDDAYDGISAEIIQRIEEDGGSTPLNRVLDELPRKFGVSENSVRAYMATPKFVIEEGRIRLRGEHEEYRYQRSEVRDAPGVFALGDGVVGLLYEVDSEVTRGSGRQLSPAAGALLGLSVNERLRFDGPHDTSVTVTFPGTSLTGPSLGSTRGLAEAVNAMVGDMLTVILRRAEMTVSAQATDLKEHDAGWALVRRLTGISENAGMDGLAAALHCSRGEVRATLRARRDTAVLEALPERRSTPDLEEALAALDAEMQREERP
ncbi:MAG: hypothetical protein OXC06_15760 [Acidimicrobiaceae bacterium]|nr:hypothetical protein [Acidimicrobiaceae bacterium]